MPEWQRRKSCSSFKLAFGIQCQFVTAAFSLADSSLIQHPHTCSAAGIQCMFRMTLKTNTNFFLQWTVSAFVIHAHNFDSVCKLPVTRRTRLILARKTAFFSPSASSPNAAATTNLNIRLPFYAACLAPPDIQSLCSLNTSTNTRRQGRAS